MALARARSRKTLLAAKTPASCACARETRIIHDPIRLSQNRASSARDNHKANFVSCEIVAATP